jgi:hypothetical protein
MLKGKQSTRATFRHEPVELTKLVSRKAKDIEDDASFERFVRHRFGRPFEHSVRWSFRYSTAFTALTIVVIAGGVTSSVLAALPGHEGDLVIAVLGVLVAVTAAVNRLWRPGARAVLRHRTANALRREGWSFVCDQGAYGAAESNPIDLFFEEVERINMPAEAIDEQEPDEGPA